MSLLSFITDVEWMPQRNRVVNESPFTGRRQHSTLRFNRWQFIVHYRMTRGANALTLLNELRALRGGDVSFNFRDPSRATPSTGYTGTGTIDTSATGYSIPITGFDINTLVAKAGDMMSVQVGGTDWQLFTVASNVTTDGSGEATVSVDNPVRGTAANGNAVRFNNWLVTVTLEDDEKWRFDKNNNLIVPPLKFVEDF